MPALLDLSDRPGRKPGAAGELPLRDRRAPQLLQSLGHPCELSRGQPRFGLLPIRLCTACVLHWNQHGELHS